MTNVYAADDVQSIAKRWKEIASAEGPISNDDVGSASGRDLRILANRYGVKWTEDDADFTIRTAIRQAMGG